MTKLFDKAIEEIHGISREPQSFIGYAESCNIKANTANSISIQSYSQLAPELKSNNIMVFRLDSRNVEKGNATLLILLRSPIMAFRVELNKFFG